MRVLLKKIFPGVSWQNPILNVVFKFVDPIDYIFRSARGLSYLPRYSIRVRSNGINKQFGGRNFYRIGNQLSEYLKTYASLSKDSKVLEIGCGCGRTAFALARVLDDGNFTGIDIEKQSLESCKHVPLLSHKRFRFDYLDVQNNTYNPTGASRADEYKFPYKGGEFDIIYLISVFTHMLTNDVNNYITEISRMLRPGGICMVSTFLMDKGRKTNGLSFPHNKMDHYFFNVTMPEVAVGYYFEYYKKQFLSCGMQQAHTTLWGSWRNDHSTTLPSGFSQDIIFVTKNA